MPSLRDLAVGIVIASVAEGYLILHFAPELKPTGGLGRLGERLFLVNFGLLIFYRVLIWPFFINPLRHLPGPSGGNLIIGHGLSQFKKPPGEDLRKMVDNTPNDGLLYFRGFFNEPIVLPTKHETLKAVMSDHTYDYEKPNKFVRILRRILGDGLILVEGNIHKFQRKHLMPSFQVKHIRNLYPMFWAKACEMTEALPSESPASEVSSPNGFVMEFGNWCMRVTLDIIGIAGFGRDFNSLKNTDDPLVHDYHEVLEPHNEKLLWFALNVIFPPWIIGAIPWHINTNLQRIQNNLYKFAYDMVHERRAEFAKFEKKNGRVNSTSPVGTTPPHTAALEKPNLDSASAENSDNDKTADLATGGRNDILSLLVASNDFTDHDLAHQVLTMMAAGHETTSSALSWCCYNLASDPALQNRLREEIRTHLPSPSELSKGKNITASQIDSLPILNGVCQETLRLYPTVPVTIRHVVKPTTLQGYELPEGTQVLLAPWAINRSSHFWGPNANEFDVGRWINADGTPNNNGGCASNYAQITFLHGPRSCIGQGFARSELKCLLAATIGRWNVELTKPKEEYKTAGLVTTKPEGGMWLRFKRIEGW